MNSTNNKVKEKNKLFNWGMFITLLVNTILGVGGWYAVNQLNKSRDIENKKREIKIEYLIKAYRSIQECSGYPIRDFTQASEKDIYHLPSNLVYFNPFKEELRTCIIYLYFCFLCLPLGKTLNILPTFLHYFAIIAFVPSFFSEFSAPSAVNNYACFLYVIKKTFKKTRHLGFKG